MYETRRENKLLPKWSLAYFVNKVNRNGSYEVKTEQRTPWIGSVPGNLLMPDYSAEQFDEAGEKRTLWEVKDIVAHRPEGDREYVNEYRGIWKGYEDDGPQWVKVEDTENTDRLMMSYWKERKQVNDVENREQKRKERKQKCARNERTRKRTKVAAEWLPIVRV